jgi:hypothetical protein
MAREENVLGMSLRLELVPQQLARGSDALERRGGQGGVAANELQGELLSSLSLSVDLDGSDALVIVPDSPDADWGKIGVNGAEKQDAEKGQGHADVPTPREDGGMAFTEPRALGPLMMTSTDETSGRRIRQVLVLIPRVSDRFRVLPEP